MPRPPARPPRPVRPAPPARGRDRPLPRVAAALLAAAALAAALVACGGAPGPGADPAARTRVLSPAAGATLERVAPDGTLAFHVSDGPALDPAAAGELMPSALVDAPERLDDPRVLRVGDVIASAPTDAAPYGLLKRVVAIRTVAVDGGARLEVETVDATLEEAIAGAEVPEGSYELRLDDLDLEGAVAVYDPEVLELSAPAGAGGAATWATEAPEARGELEPAASLPIAGGNYCFDKRIVGAINGVPGRLRGCIELDAYLEARLDIGIRWRWFVPVPELREFLAQAVGTVRGDIRASTTSSLSVFAEELVIASFRLPTAVAWVGPIPVVLTPTYDVIARLDGTLEVSADLHAAASVDARLGGRWTKSEGWRAIRSFRHDFNVSSSRTSVGFDITAGVAGARTSMLLYGVVGPTFALVPEAHATFTTPPPRGVLSAGLTAYIGIDATRIWRRLERSWPIRLASFQVGRF